MVALLNNGCLPQPTATEEETAGAWQKQGLTIQLSVEPQVKLIDRVVDVSIVQLAFSGVDVRFVIQRLVLAIWNMESLQVQAFGQGYRAVSTDADCVVYGLRHACVQSGCQGEISAVIGWFQVVTASGVDLCAVVLLHRWGSPRCEPPC